ncbi:MAG: hypothetical protein Q4C04_03305 [Clostridia bacterium]|nr:hypothetical protein [Clostridia bacterium]
MKLYYVFLVNFTLVAASVFALIEIVRTKHRPSKKERRNAKSTERLVRQGLFFLGVLALTLFLPVFADFPAFVSDNYIEKTGTVIYSEELQSSNRRPSWMTAGRRYTIVTEDSQEYSIRANNDYIEAGTEVEVKILPISNYAEISSHPISAQNSFVAHVVLLLIWAIPVYYSIKHRKREIVIRESLFLPCAKIKTRKEAVWRTIICVLNVGVYVLLLFTAPRSSNGQLQLPNLICIAVGGLVGLYFIPLSIFEAVNAKKAPSKKDGKKRIAETPLSELTVEDAQKIIGQEDVVDITIKVNGTVIRMGARSDYSNEEGFFDKCYYIEQSEYESYEEFQRITDELTGGKAVSVTRIE